MWRQTDPSLLGTHVFLASFAAPFLRRRSRVRRRSFQRMIGHLEPQGNSPLGFARSKSGEMARREGFVDGWKKVSSVRACRFRHEWRLGL